MQELANGFEIFIKLIACIKNLNIDYEYAIENNGTITCWTETPHIIEDAPTIEEGIALLLKSLRERAYDYMNEFDLWLKGCPEELPYIIKIILSSDRELESSLELHKKVEEPGKFYPDSS